MAYVVTNTRGQIIAVVQDGTVDTTSTSQTLVGKNVTPYGEYEVENLVHQLENFANSSPPGNPIEGQLWWDTGNKLLKAWNGNAWSSVSPDGTSLNIGDRVVLRDGSGNFAAGTVTVSGLEANTVLVKGSGGNSTLSFQDADGNLTDTKIYYANATNNLNIAVNSGVVASFSQNSATFNYPVSIPLTPTVNTQAASKGYVDTAISSAPYGTGSVTSVALQAGNGINITGSPITSSGTITVGVDYQTANVASSVVGRDSTGSFSANTVTLKQLTANTVVSTGNTLGSYLRLVDNVGDANDTFVWYENASQSIKLQVNGNTPAAFSNNSVTFNYPVTLSGAPTAALQAATKSYVDTSVAAAGTVTSIGVTNGGGIAVTGSPITTSGSISISVISTSDPTPSYIVSRDSNGSFAGNRVTAKSVFSDTVTVSGNSGVANLNFASGQGNLTYNTAAGSLSVGLSGNSVAVFYPTYTTFNYPANVPLTPTQLTHATSKQYVDNAVASAIAGVGGGTVTSIGIINGSGIAVSGSPVTTSGNITVSVVSTSNPSPNYIVSRDANGSFTANIVNATNFVGSGVLIQQVGGIARLNFTDSAGSNTATGLRYNNSTSGLIVSVNNGNPVTFYSGNTTFSEQVYLPQPTGPQSAATKTYVDNAISANLPSPYTLPIASSTVLGGVKVGNNLSINNGVLSAVIPPNPTPTPAYVLPIASASVLGGFKVGSGLSINPSTGVLTATVVPASGITQIVAGNGLTGGTITSPGGTITVDSSVIRSNVAQTISTLKTFTGGIQSQAYNFTYEGASIFYRGPPFDSFPEPVVMIPVNNTAPFDYSHQFYRKRYICEGSADATTPSSSRPSGGAIMGIDNGTSGGCGIIGWHTQGVPGLGIGTGGYASNMAFTGDVFQSAAARSSSSSFDFFQAYSSNYTLPVSHFQLRGDGNAFASGSWASTGADYAEYFESTDGSALETGITVVLADNKVRSYQPGDSADDIIGVVRPKNNATSTVVGNTAFNHWNQRYLTDDFGSVIMEPHSIYQWTEKIKDGDYESTKYHSYESHCVPSDITIPDHATIVTHDEKGKPFVHAKENPAYDPTIEYIPREDRAEWNIIGLLGQVPVKKGQTVHPRWKKMKDISSSVELWYIR